MKKFVNDPKNYVAEMLEGVALANPDSLRYVPAYNLIMRADAPRDDKVSIVQGSGSGHEPAQGTNARLSITISTGYGVGVAVPTPAGNGKDQ